MTSTTNGTNGRMAMMSAALRIVLAILVAISLALASWALYNVSELGKSVVHLDTCMEDVRADVRGLPPQHLKDDITALKADVKTLIRQMAAIEGRIIQLQARGTADVDSDIPDHQDVADVVLGPRKAETRKEGAN